MQTGFPLTLELPEEDEFFDDKADILEVNGLSESQEFILTSGEEPSADLLAFLRLINLSGLSLLRHETKPRIAQSQDLPMLGKLKASSFAYCQIIMALSEGIHQAYHLTH